MSYVRELSFVASQGGTSQKVAVTTSNTQSTALSRRDEIGQTADVYVLVTPDVACFFRQGSNPTAVSDGTDQYLAATVTYRVRVTGGNKLAFITGTGSGNVYLTPEV
jgi:hypothetical protein